MNVFAVKLANRNVFRQGARSLMPLLVVAIGSFVIILIGGMYQYMFDLLETQSIRADGQLWLTKPGAEATQAAQTVSAPLMNEAAFQAIGAVPEVLALAPRATVSGVVGSGDRSSIFSGGFVDPRAEACLRSYKRNEPVKAASGARIGRFLAAGLQLKPDEWISGLAADQGFSAQVGELVTTEAEERDRFFLELPFSAMGGVNWDLVDSIHLLVKDGTNLDALGQTIQTRLEAAGLPAATIHTYREQSGYVSSVRTIYGNNLTFIIIVLAITIFFGIATAFTMSITERSQELGTLRSFGASSSHIGSLFTVEALLVAFYGFLGGLVLALIAGRIINAAGGTVLPTPPTATAPLRLSWVFAPQYALIALVLVLSVAFLSAQLTTARLGRLHIIAQLNLNS